MQSLVPLLWDQSDGDVSPKSVVSLNRDDRDWRDYGSIAGCA
jgi:hypothetical protein